MSRGYLPRDDASRATADHQKRSEREHVIPRRLAPALISPAPIQLLRSAPPELLTNTERLRVSLDGAGVFDRLNSQEQSVEEGPAVHEAAARGTAGSGGPLPHLEKIQASFGKHDVTSVQAHTGGAATAANQEMGARAFAAGNHVAFRSSPDLHTTAHEAAHVIQQRGGVQLKGGVGEVGDCYERHADQVADMVVQGRSAEGLLDQLAGATGRVIQRNLQLEPEPNEGAGQQTVEREALLAKLEVLEYLVSRVPGGRELLGAIGYAKDLLTRASSAPPGQSSGLLHQARALFADVQGRLPAPKPDIGPTLDDAAPPTSDDPCAEGYDPQRHLPALDIVPGECYGPNHRGDPNRDPARQELLTEYYNAEDVPRDSSTKERHPSDIQADLEQRWRDLGCPAPPSLGLTILQDMGALGEYTAEKGLYAAAGMAAAMVLAAAIYAAPVVISWAGATIASEASLLAFTLQNAGRCLLTLTLSNPLAAEAVAEFLVGTIITIAMSGLDQFVEGLQTPEGAAQTVFELLVLRYQIKGSSGFHEQQARPRVKGGNIEAEIIAPPPSLFERGKQKAREIGQGIRNKAQDVYDALSPEYPTANNAPLSSGKRNSPSEKRLPRPHNDVEVADLYPDRRQDGPDAADTVSSFGERSLEKQLGDEGLDMAGARSAGVHVTTPYRAGATRRPRHHVLPQERREWFEERGFVGNRDIDNFTIELGGAEHEAIHGGGNYKLARSVWPEGEWNTALFKRLDKTEGMLGRKLKPDEIFHIVEELRREFKFDGLPYVHFKAD